MPVLRNRAVFEIPRNLRAFFGIEVGITRGKLPDAQEKEEEVARLEQRLERASQRIAGQQEQISDLRRRLAGGERRATPLPERPNNAGASAHVAGGAAVRGVVEDFHRLYYEAGNAGGTWHNTYWMGVPTLKCPLDLWVYAEMLFELRPEVIVETGTAFGGSALFLASVCDLLGTGRIVTVDLKGRAGHTPPRHDRIEYLRGSSTSEEIVAKVQSRLADGAMALVILDSDHSREHVLEELEVYSGLVEPGGYIIVEDTNINGHPVMPEFGPGPMEAVEEFLRTNDGFVVDRDREKFYLTFNPKGYLKRIG
jgi:cephalosporin hydroxylase